MFEANTYETGQTRWNWSKWVRNHLNSTKKSMLQRQDTNIQETSPTSTKTWKFWWKFKTQCWCIKVKTVCKFCFSTQSFKASQWMGMASIRIAKWLSDMLACKFWSAYILHISIYVYAYVNCHSPQTFDFIHTKKLISMFIILSTTDAWRGISIIQAMHAHFSVATRLMCLGAQKL